MSIDGAHRNLSHFGPRSRPSVSTWTLTRTLEISKGVVCGYNANEKRLRLMSKRLKFQVLSGQDSLSHL